MFCSKTYVRLPRPTVILWKMTSTTMTRKRKGIKWWWFCIYQNPTCFTGLDHHIFWMKLFKQITVCSQISSGFGGVSIYIYVFIFCLVKCKGKHKVWRTFVQSPRHKLLHGAYVPCFYFKPLTSTSQSLFCCFFFGAHFFGPSGLAISEGFTEEAAQLWLWKTNAHSGSACLKIFNAHWILLVY